MLTRRNWVRSTWELSGLSLQLSCKPQNTPKSKFIRKRGVGFGHLEEERETRLTVEQRNIFPVSSRVTQGKLSEYSGSIGAALQWVQKEG